MAAPASPTTRRNRVIGAVIAIILLGALAAIMVNRSGAEKVLNGNKDTLVLVGKKSSSSMMAREIGTLADVGGCLGLKDQGRASIVIWPHGTTIKSPEPLRVRINGKTYELGDKVDLGGGNIGPLKKSSYFYDQVPKTCLTPNVFLAGSN